MTSTLQMFKVPAAPMYAARDQLHDPHFQARGYPRWIEQQVAGWMAMEGPCFQASGMNDVQLFQAPLVGKHTREIAREILGLTDAEIEAKTDTIRFHPASHQGDRRGMPLTVGTFVRNANGTMEVSHFYECGSFCASRHTAALKKDRRGVWKVVSSRIDWISRSS